jgi:metal-responsive CopG/Arc/MetJ family transcriptional regulator
MVEEASIALNKTSASRRLAGSLATEKWHKNEQEQFNAILNYIKEHHSQEMAKLQKQMETLKMNPSLEELKEATDMKVSLTAVSTRRCCLLCSQTK